MDIEKDKSYDNYQYEIIDKNIMEIVYAVLPLSAKMMEEELYEEQGQYINTIVKNCYNLLRTTQLQSLYDNLSNDLMFELTSYNLNDFLLNYYEAIRPLVIHGGYNIKLLICDEIIISKINVDYLMIALTNVIANSCMYAAKETTINISLKYLQNNYYITIKDEGDGMDNDIAKNIFKPNYYYNPNNNEKKLGLGLTVSKMIIEHHNGEIFTVTMINQGTTIGIKIPVDNDIPLDDLSFRSSKKIILNNSGFSPLAVAFSPVYQRRII